MADKEKAAKANAPSARRKILDDRLKALGVSPKCVKIGDYDDVSYVSTGIADVDGILGAGMGVPKGTLLQLVGESQSGKSYLAMALAAQCHSEGLRVAFLNVENSFFPPRAEEIGVDVHNEDLFELYENLGKAELWGNLLLALIQSGEYGLVVVDSITALNPEQEYDRDLDDSAVVGVHARFIQRMIKRAMSDCANTDTICVVINQFRMGQGFRKGEMVRQGTGGKALDYFCHMIFEVDRMHGAPGQLMDEDNNIVGGKSRLKVAKTRYSQPGLLTEFNIMFGKAESDPISEFLHRCMKALNADKKPYIAYMGRNPNKKYVYADPISGEIVAEHKDRLEFIKMLMDGAAPEKLTRGDTSKTAFQYLCGRIKASEKMVSNIEKVVASGVMVQLKSAVVEAVDVMSRDFGELLSDLDELTPEEEEAING